MRRAAAVNAVLLLAAWAAQAPAAPGWVRMGAAAALVLVVPGASWLGAFRTTFTPARVALAVGGISCLSALVGCAVSAMFAPPLTALPFLVWTAVASNAGLLAGRRPVDFELGARWGVLAAVCFAGFLATSWAGLRLVPPLEDHDMEVRGTAYGLLTEGKPYFTSNRQLELPMSHPVAFNVLVADSLLVAGQVDATRPSYDSAKRAEAARRAGTPFDWEGAWRGDHAAFVATPALIGTRAPSALIAGIVLALLVDCVRRITGSLAAGLGAAAFYASVPETIVRSAYAGYFGETVLAMLVATLVFTEPDAPGRVARTAAAGLLMAILDHKTVLLVLALATWYGGRALLARARPDGRAVALVAGFGAGTFIWWGYGFWVDAGIFVADHLRKHIAHRILLNDVRFATDTINHYAPSIVELWREFAAHTGWLLVPCALVGACLALLRRRDERLVVLALWCLSGALAYSLVDWRQTKHLMNGLVPMVALAVCLAVPPRRWRALALAALLLAAGVNLAAAARLVGDFTSLKVSGASDIDGW